MRIEANSVDDYFQELPPDRKDAMIRLRAVILEHLPAGFAEELGSGMPSYVVPHEVYPAGYHCNPETPLPFMSLASQKNFITLHHMGLYADQELLAWFTSEYADRVPTKLDMGKGCIRFKKMEHIPYDLVGELVAKVTSADWISAYEGALAR